MEKKDYIQTLRLTENEWKETNAFLKLNLAFESFSSLARIAIREFIKKKYLLETIPLQETYQERPYFLWDYDLTEAKVHEILSQPNFNKKKWLIARILERAIFSDVWKYLSLEDIRAALPSLRMSSKKKEYWNYAIKIWTKQ